MHQDNKNQIVRDLFVLALPISLFAAQSFDFVVAAILAFAFLIIAFLSKTVKKESILISALILGYLFCVFMQKNIQTLCTNNAVANEISIILSRFGLIGYLVLLTILHHFDKIKENYFRLGSLDAKIKIPFIWFGFNDNVLRVATVFSLFCMVAASTSLVYNQSSFWLIGAGVTFSFVNSILEELLWRGFVLSRLIDSCGKKTALIVMSLLFGIYHYSMGFSLPICLLFSLGGIYFGGITIQSNGLLLATIMHFSMNMLFVSIGIIF